MKNVPQNIPDKPGVYFFLSRAKKPLYIGRATSLRSRVQSYFSDDIAEKRSSWIERMVSEARGVEYTQTASVLEAILLEADLIRKFNPPYNTKEKDDKSYNCIAVTDEEFPRVLLVRNREISSSQNRILQSPRKRSGRFNATTRSRHLQNAFCSEHSYHSVFGPFSQPTHLRIALKIIRKIFPFRDSCVPNTTPCFNRQLGLCPGVCTGEVSAVEYRRHIKRLEVFLSGKTERVSRALEHVMKTAARAQEFEKANAFKRQLFALRHIQDVALIKNPPPTPSFSKGGGEGGGFRKFRIESYDLSHFGGKGIVGAMAVVENGRAQQSEYRLFHIRSTKTQNEVAGLQEILTRRLTHREWPLPHLIVVDGNAVQKRAAEIVLARHAFAIPVVAVVKDERHRPREIIGGVRYGSAEERAIVLANSEAHRFVLRFQKKQGYNKM